MATGHASENALYVALPCSTCPIKKALSLRWQTYGLLEDILSLHSFMCFLILFIEKNMHRSRKFNTNSKMYGTDVLMIRYALFPNDHLFVMYCFNVHRYCEVNTT